MQCPNRVSVPYSIELLASDHPFTGDVALCTPHARCTVYKYTVHTFCIKTMLTVLLGRLVRQLHIGGSLRQDNGSDNKHRCRPQQGTDEHQQGSVTARTAAARHAGNVVVGHCICG